jgi:hypothetical protein
VIARTVGLPCSVAALVLDRVLHTPGVRAPYTKEMCDPIWELLDEGLGLRAHHRTVYGAVRVRTVP